MMINKEDIQKMYEAGYSVEEIAENHSADECVQEFREVPYWCHEDADCHDCWIRCLKLELE